MLKMCEQRIYWPNMAKSFQATRDNCNWCIRRAPSHAKLPPAEIEEPNAPMESICIDFAMIDGDRFGIMVDRYSNWPAVWSCKGTSLCHWLRKHIENFGAPRIISTDRGREFESSEFKRMLETYNIHHRESSAYNPHSNNRVETAVKTMKRLLAPVNVRCDLQNDEFVRAITGYRNTPPEHNTLSPNELLFGRTVRDFLPDNEEDTMETPGRRNQAEFEAKLRAREKAKRISHDECAERWAEHTKNLPALENGDNVAIQNGGGNSPTRWDLRGKVVRYNGYDQYDVMVAGSRRITTRNRSHLRKLKVDVDVSGERIVMPPVTRPDPEENVETETLKTRENEKLETGTLKTRENPPDPKKNPEISPAQAPAPAAGGGQGHSTPSPAPRRSSRRTAGTQPAYLKDYHVEAIMAIVMAAAAAQEEEIVRHE